MTRRGFFGALSALVAGFCSVRLPPFVPRPFTFHGVPVLVDEAMGNGTMIGINRATFKFWRNIPQPSPHDPAEWTTRAEAMSHGMMKTFEECTTR